MEYLIIIGLIWWVISVFSKLKNNNNPPSSSNSTSYRSKIDPTVYRPSVALKKPSTNQIRFRDISHNNVIITDQAIKDLVDALTGVPLDINLGLYQCQKCKVFYQAQSYEVIRSENNGRCVSCLNTQIVGVQKRSEQRGHNAEVSVVTLENYHNFAGHVITFEGYVEKVLTSRRGSDYAVMFENTSWTKGFKMVVFRGSLEKCGGASFLFNMTNHRVKIRGLLINHKTFGYEIIINDPAMILSIQ